MRLVGEFDINAGSPNLFYSDDNIKFYSDKNKENEYSIDDINDWAVLINSPWSQTDEKYVIKCS